jgi:serine/threonine-protein kinase
MPNSQPPMGSCPHCGAIVLWTREGLVHPMPGERERIRGWLGSSWFAHAATPFDGRFHQCLGSVRQAVAAKHQRERERARRRVLA